MNDLYAGTLVDQMEEESNLKEGLTTEEIMSCLIATKIIGAPDQTASQLNL